MKHIPNWIKFPVIQLLIYLTLYEFFRFFLREVLKYKINTGLGISIQYLLYFYIFFNILMFVILLFQKDIKWKYLLILLTIYILSCIIFFKLNVIIITLLFISIFSTIISYLLFRETK